LPNALAVESDHAIRWEDFRMTQRSRTVLTLLLAVAALSSFPQTSSANENPQTALINKHIVDGWQKAGIKKASEKATDLEFMRRAFIDLIGRIPSYEEAMDFDQDKGSNKRSRLINRLLYSKDYKPKVNGKAVQLGDKKELTYSYVDEFAEHWANIWTVWLLTRTGHPVYREQIRVWLEGEFGANLQGTVSTYEELVTKLLTATGRSDSNGAVNFIVHHLGEANPADKQAAEGKFDAVPITSRITRLFLGIQTNCVQCHDHPFNKEWVQGDFWGVNAFFRQTERDRTPTGAMDRQMMAEPAKVTLGDTGDRNTNGVIFYERRDGKLMATKPNFLKDLAKAEAGEADSKPLSEKNRRAELAKFVIKHDNFSKAYINRVWGHLFGRGLNKEPSIDDFGSHNEVVHPELLTDLAKEFSNYKFDLKKLLLWICTSDVYGLSHVAMKENADPKFDPYFARMPLKSMSPEVLYDSLQTAIRSEVDSKQRKTQRDQWMGKLVRNFGDDEGNEMTFNGTVVQALLMMNGRELNDEIGASQNPRATVANSPLMKIVQKHAKSGNVSSGAVIDELFMATLTRHPTSAELSKINSLMNKGAIIAGESAKPSGSASKPEPAKPDPKADPKAKPKGKQPATPTAVPSGPRGVPASGPNDPTFYQDLFWALINTNEFILNH
jgi:Protein of unknown function (DUF1553)/Protein of unknown function (DUF1549)